MRIKAIVIAACGAAVLASAPVSATAVDAKQRAVGMSLQQPSTAAASQINRPVYQPIETNLARTCSDSWWTMSGIQALTCLYMAAR